MIHITGQKYHDKIAMIVLQESWKALLFLPFLQALKELLHLFSAMVLVYLLLHRPNDQNKTAESHQEVPLCSSL